uniref:Mastoparan-VT5 n=1 Tax=Vespa tropica TaxID=7450 RepID=MAST5_VESTR|nr:RecName: Full=Mastoparan-VT5; Flags: Precursor [Vespa tropica]
MKNTILILFTAFIALLGFFGMIAEPLADPLADPLPDADPDADPETVIVKAIATLSKKLLR